MRQAFTLIEVLLVIALLAALIAFVFPDFQSQVQHMSLAESADRLRSCIVRAHAEAMRDGMRYRIEFPGTPDPLDPKADKQIDVPIETQQPILTRQADPLGNPEIFGDFDAPWKGVAVLQQGTRCVAVLPGKPNFDISGTSPIAGPSISRDQTTFVPLTLNPDGTCEDWVTFVLTDLPVDHEVQSDDVGHILNVIVDARTGQTWLQRALRREEVEVMNEHGASPILHMDFTNAELITEKNILEIHVRQSGGPAQVGPGGAG